MGISRQPFIGLKSTDFWRRIGQLQLMTDVMTIRCPPHCESDCQVAHHPLLIALLNTVPKEGNPTSFTALEATISRYEKIGDWSKDDDIPDPVEKFRYPLLIWAASLGMIDVVRWLKDHQFSQVVRCSATSEGALHIVVKQIWEKRTSSPVRDPVGYLQKLIPLLPGALTIRDKDGNSPLHLCCDLFSQDVVQKGIFQECAVVMLDFAMEKNKAIVSTLVNTQNNSGNTCVHLLTLHDRCLKLVKHICGLDKADISIKNCLNQTPIEMAVENGAIKISSFLSTCKSVSGLKEGKGSLFSDEEMPRKKRKIHSSPKQNSLEEEVSSTKLCKLKNNNVSRKVVYPLKDTLNKSADLKIVSSEKSPERKRKLLAHSKESTQSKREITSHSSSQVNKITPTVAKLSSDEKKVSMRAIQSPRYTCHNDDKVLNSQSKVWTPNMIKPDPKCSSSQCSSLQTCWTPKHPGLLGLSANYFQSCLPGQDPLTSKQGRQPDLRPSDGSTKATPNRQLEKLYFRFPHKAEVNARDGHSNVEVEASCTKNNINSGNVDAIIISSADGKGMSLVKSDSNRLLISKLSPFDEAFVRPLCKATDEGSKSTKTECSTSSQSNIKNNGPEKSIVSSIHDLKSGSSSNVQSTVNGRMKGHPENGQTISKTAHGKLISGQVVNTSTSANPSSDHILKPPTVASSNQQQTHSKPATRLGIDVCSLASTYTLKRPSNVTATITKLSKVPPVAKATKDTAYTMTNTINAQTCMANAVTTNIKMSVKNSSQIPQVSSSVSNMKIYGKANSEHAIVGQQKGKSWRELPEGSKIKIEILDDDDDDDGTDEYTVTSGSHHVSEQKVSTTNGKDFKWKENESSTVDSPTFLALSSYPLCPVISSVVSLAASSTNSTRSSHTQKTVTDVKDSIPSSSSCMSTETRKLIHDSILRDKEKIQKEKEVVLKSKTEIKKVALEVRQKLVAKNQRIQSLLKELENLQREVLVLGNTNVQHIKSEDQIEHALKDIEAKEAAYDKALAEIGIV